MRLKTNYQNTIRAREEFHEHHMFNDRVLFDTSWEFNTTIQVLEISLGDKRAVFVSLKDYMKDDVLDEFAFIES